MKEIPGSAEVKKWGYRQPVILIESQSAPVLYGDQVEQRYMRGCNIATAGDLVVTDFPLDEVYLEYLRDTLGFELPDYLEAANYNAGCLSDNLMHSGNREVCDAIREWWKRRDEKAKLQFFNITNHELEVANLLGIESTCGDPKMALEVGSKPGFRKLCEQLGLPMPRGFVCSNLIQTVSAVTSILGDGHDALIKAENGTGGSELKSNILVPKELLAQNLSMVIQARLAEIGEFLGKEWVVEERVDGDDGSIHVYIADETKAEKAFVLGAISENDSYVGGYYPFVPDKEQQRMMAVVDEVLVPALQGLSVFGPHCFDFRGKYLLEDNVRPGALDFIDGMVARVASKHFGGEPYAYWHCHVGTSRPTNFYRVFQELGEYLNPVTAPKGLLAMVSNQEVLPFGRSLDLTAISFGSDASVEKAREFFAKLELLVREKI